MEIDDDTREEIEHLKQQGEHAAAASALWAVGFPREAAEIFEEIFEHENALSAFEDAEDVVGAMRIALLLGDQRAVDRVVTRALKAGKAEALIGALRRGNRLVEIGRIHQVNGDMEAAATAFEEGGALLDAAKAREAMGDHRVAGVLYERYLEQDANEPEASFRLGRILCRFSRNEDGISLLQQALESDPSRERLCECAPHMVLGFERLGYEKAATTLLEKWQRENAALKSTSIGGSVDVPESLEAFLSSPYAQSWSMNEESEKKEVKKDEPQPSGLDALFGDATVAPVNDNSSSSDDLKPASADEDLDEAREKEALLAGRYLLGEPLGGGGVGQVFRAFDIFMDRPAAVKIFGKQALASDAIVAYAREARAAASLGHPAITPLVELDLAHGFQVTDLVGGELVESRLQKGGDSSWLRPMTHSLLELLQTCHRAGLVHGALKPTNLFLIPGGLRVVDFGAHHLLSLRSTETGGLSSSWPYLAPEQLFGAPADVQTDLYALAALLYRAFTGYAPFRHAQADRRAPPTPAKKRCADVDEGWNLFLEKALSPKADQRFPDALSFLEALPEFSEGALPMAAIPEGRAKPAALLFDEDGRYRKGALVFRTGEDVRVYEGEDLALHRQVWLVESNVEHELDPLIAVAKVGSGVQPVYDVQQGEKRVIVARDSTRKRRTTENLKQIPQSLSQDFMQLASSIHRLHQEGYAFGGFDYKRAVGPIGPRMRLAPAQLPLVSDDEKKEADWKSFGKAVQISFGSAAHLLEDENDAAADHALPDEFSLSLSQEHFIFLLEQDGFLQREDSLNLRSLIEENAPWHILLAAVSKTLILRAPVRVISRLIASVVEEPS
ncbi:MAG: protein kinase [Deltaproteobacteria bacterium]|nr:protein kinase [Deltaproteobacteria bacterium]